jgi:ATP synthase protein I
MLANDARILTRSAVATAISGAILIAVGAIVDGGKGALGAAFGVILVTIFFTVSVLAVSYAGRRLGPNAMTGTALGTFAVKILALLAVLAAVQGTTAFNTKIFGITAIVCILVWTGGQVFTLARSRMPYVVPEASGAGVVPEASGAGVVPEASGAGVVPEASGAGVVPEASGAGVVPEASGADTAPEVRQASAVPEARKASGDR